MKEISENIDYIAVEAKYASSKRRADVLVSGQDICAFEIKSDQDSLKRIHDQIEDYKKTFDKFFIVTTPKHLRKIKKILGKKTGLMLFENGEIRVVKEAISGSAQTKNNLVAICSRSTLENYVEGARKYKNVDQMREFAKRNLSREELKRLAHDELSDRFKYRYEIFIMEACIPLRETDLKALQHGRCISL